MRQTNAYVIGFAAIVCVVCSLLLATVSGALSSRQEQNRVLDRQKNVLLAAGIDAGTLSKLKGDEVQALYAKRIEELVIDRQGEVLEGVKQDELSAKEASNEAPSDRLPLYRVKGEDGSSVEAYIYPATGKGLWSTMYAYVAVKPNGSEIVGIAFYAHGETPGLGAEIEREWFTSNFKGKQLYAGDQLVGVEVVKGKVADRVGVKTEHAVDGISGATLTQNGVTKMLQVVPRLYEPFFKKQGGQKTAQLFLEAPASVEALR